MTEKGKAGKIQLPREMFQSLSSRTVRVVVSVLNIQQLHMFKVGAGMAGTPPATSTRCLPSQLRQSCSHAGGQPDGAGPGQHCGGHHSGRDEHLWAAGPCAAHLRPWAAAPRKLAVPSLHLSSGAPHRGVN